MFLLCTIDARAALAVWAAGVIVTQLTSGKRRTSQLFNIGVGILAGAIAAGLLTLVRGSGTETPRELVAVALAAGRVLLHRLRRLGHLDGHRLQHARARAPAAARHLAGRRLLRALRPARLPRRGRAAQRAVVDADPADDPARHPARGHPGRHPADARTPGGSPCCWRRRSAPRRCTSPRRSSTPCCRTPASSPGCATSSSAAHRRRSTRSAPRYAGARTPRGWSPRPGTGPGPRSPPTSTRSTPWRPCAPTPSPGCS